MGSNTKKWTKISLIALSLTIGYTSCSSDDQVVIDKQETSDVIIQAVGYDYTTNYLVSWQDNNQTILEDEPAFIFDPYVIEKGGGDTYILPEDKNKYFYWKNNIFHEFPTKQIGEVKYVKVVGEDLFTLNYSANLSSYVYYKNFKDPVALELFGNAYIYSIDSFTANSDNCYVLGQIYNDIEDESYDSSMVLWENGKMINMWDLEGSHYSFSQAKGEVFIIEEIPTDVPSQKLVTVWDRFDNPSDFIFSEKDIFIEKMIFDGQNLHAIGTKWDSGSQQATYWLNGKSVWSSSDGTYSLASDIIVDQKDVYILGQVDGEAVAWKNTKIIWQVDHPSLAQSFTISKKTNNN